MDWYPDQDLINADWPKKTEDRPPEDQGEPTPFEVELAQRSPETLEKLQKA
jgi:hypothetical protein